MTDPSTPVRAAISPLLRESGIVAVLRAGDGSDYAPVVERLVGGGIRSIELTFTTPGTLDALPALLADFGSEAEIGVGTVTSTELAHAAIAAGAHYLVTPNFDPAVVGVAVAGGTPIFCGGLTPTELFGAWSAGATAVKIFPAETVGAQYGGHLRGPFPELEFLPSGGVGLDDIGAWIRAGAVAVSLGGPLLGDALKGGSPAELDERIVRARDAVAAAKDAR